MAGFKPGQLIGPAYGASVLLARTENDASETPLEEDNWVAALEWADSLGVDVISASLAYLEYDEGFADWTWEDMDGNTTVVTQAADHAVSLGIVVVNSAGNRGLPLVGQGNSLMAPADGDSVLTIGSVTNAGARSSFSSVGPTFDGRIKPDLMAQGSSTRCASSSNQTGYSTASGTSLSCPLVAGVVAQLLSAQPTATPMMIRDALRLTASQSQSPDSLMGWGIVNAVSALAFLQATDAQQPLPAATRLIANVPNPFNPVTTISYKLATAAHVTLRVFDVRGQLVRTLVAETQQPQQHNAVWDGRHDDGRAVASGIYFARLRTRSHAGLAPSSPGTDSIRKMTLVR
jgi:subtilisin family serine protease